MEKNSFDFSSIDKQKLDRLARSDTARQLISLLQNADPAALRMAARQASDGDMAGAGAALQQLMADPKAKLLLQKLQEEQNG